jgi:flavorubredoxin
VELVPRRLYAVGDTIELDGRVSWASPDARGYQPVNAYLLLEGSSALLIDTGLSCHEEAVISQLEQLLPADCTFNLFLTRAAFECVGNLQAVTMRFSVQGAHAGGGTNPFDAFDVVHAIGTNQPVGRQVERRPLGTKIEIGPGRRLDVLTPPFRMLPTTWAFDRETGTLFTSDAFGYGAFASPDYDPVVGPADDRLDLALARSHLASRFWWLDHLATDQLREEVHSFFAGLRVERVAPTYGGILTGAGVVARHVANFERILTPEASSARAEVAGR